MAPALTAQTSPCLHAPILMPPKLPSHPAQQLPPPYICTLALGYAFSSFLTCMEPPPPPHTHHHPHTHTLRWYRLPLASWPFSPAHPHTRTPVHSARQHVRHCRVPPCGHAARCAPRSAASDPVRPRSCSRAHPRTHTAPPKQPTIHSLPHNLDTPTLNPHPSQAPSTAASPLHNCRKFSAARGASFTNSTYSTRPSFVPLSATSIHTCGPAMTRK